MPEGQPLAFVLMPFDADFEEVYNALIFQPLTDAGFLVRRADSLLNQRNILQDVVRGIAEAELIVADVSGLNPNVMYEVGLAHGMGKRTVMITQDIDELPFDFRTYRANEYSVHFSEASKIIGTLREIGQGVLSGEIQFSNPVQDYAPKTLAEASQVNQTGRFREHAPNSTGEATQKAGDDEPEPEPGLLERASELSESSEASIQILQEITSATDQIGEQIAGHAQKLERATKNLGEKGAGVLLGLVREAARDVDTYADTLEPLNVRFRTAITSLAGAATGIAKQRDIGAEDRESLIAEIAEIRGSEDALVEAFFNITEFAQSMTDLPNMDRKMTASARRAARAVTETAEVIELAQAEFARAANLIEERLPSA